MFADLSLSRSSSKQRHTVKTALVSLQMTQIPTGLFTASETLRKYTIRYKSTVIAILETFILFIYFIIAMNVHHLGLYCILFRRFLIPQINVALQLTKLCLKKVTTSLLL